MSRLDPNGFVDYDDFGRPLSEYVRDADEHDTLVRNYVYYDPADYVVDSVTTKLSQIQIFEPRDGYADTTTTPAKISYASPDGTVLQECTYTERGDYRVIQHRIQNGGRTEIQTEPFFSGNCNFLSTLSASAATFTATKDLQGRVTYAEPPPGDATSPIGTLTYDYSTDSNGHLVKITTHSSGQTKTEVFDSTERLIQVTDTNGSLLSYDYNPVGDLLHVYENSNQITEISYDQLGRKTQMEDADMGIWRYEYDSNGRLYKQTDNKGQYTQYAYTSLGRISEKNIYNSSGVLEKKEVYTYDSSDDASFNVLSGELYKVDEYDVGGTLLRSAKYGYDSQYRRTSKVSRSIPSIGDLEQNLTYDSRGNITSVAYPASATLYYKYNRVGGLEKICSADACDSSGEIYYSVDSSAGYDQYGHLLKATYGNGVADDYAYYPSSHRLQGITTSHSSSTYLQRTYEYDSNSNITTIQDPLHSVGTGAISSVSYDSLNRLTSYFPEGVASPVTLSYSDNGNMLQNSATYGADTYQYTSSRPHAVTQIGSEEFSYDANGNMMTDAHRQMTYNSQNQLIQVIMANGTTVNYDYDYTGARISKIVSREDPSHVIHTATTYYLGDALEILWDRLVLNIYAKDKKIAVKSLGAIVDIMGGGGASLAIMGINPKASLQTFFPYLCLFAILFTLASFRPIRVPAWSYAFKQHSNRKRYSPAHSFFYTVLKSWRSYTLSLQQALSLAHQRSVFKLIVLALIFILMVQVPLTAIAGSMEMSPGPGSDTDYFYYISGDHLGSSSILTEGNPAGGMHSGIVYNRGDLIQRFEYSPYGQQKFALNPNLQFDPSYTGQMFDMETGLYYYKARYYNPQLSRFIQADTIVPDSKNLQAYNRYSYAANNPLKYIDPSGHGFWSFFKKIFGAFVGGFLSTLGFLTGNPALVLLGGAIGGAIAGGWKGALWGLAAATLALGIGQIGGALATGAIRGGISGGWKGSLMGAGLSGGQAVGQAVGGILIGLSISYAIGGWKGMAMYGSATLGSLAAYGLVGAAQSSGQGENGHAKKEDNTSTNQSQPLADNGTMNSDPNVASDVMSPYQTPTNQAVNDAATNSMAVVVDLRGSASQTVLQKVFNENTVKYWIIGPAIVGGTEGALFGFPLLGVPGGIGGFLVGAILGASYGAQFWLIGAQAADEGLWSIWIFGKPPKN